MNVGMVRAHKRVGDCASATNLVDYGICLPPHTYLPTHIHTDTHMHGHSHAGHTNARKQLFFV